MHKVASCFFGRSNSVRKPRPFAIMGDDSPDPTAVFQRTLWLRSNSMGGLPSPIPEEFGPLNCGHSAAPAKLNRTTVARRVIQEARVIINSDWDFAQVYSWRPRRIRGFMPELRSCSRLTTHSVEFAEARERLCKRRHSCQCSAV